MCNLNPNAHQIRDPHPDPAPDHKSDSQIVFGFPFPFSHDKSVGLALKDLPQLLPTYFFSFCWKTVSAGLSSQLFEMD